MAAIARPPKPVQVVSELGAKRIRTETFRSAKEAERALPSRKFRFLEVKRRGNKLIINLKTRIGTRVRKKNPNNPHPKSMDMEDMKKWIR